MTLQTGSEHAHHDPTLIAAYASDDLTGTDLERARALTSACMACAALEADVRALATATRTADLPIPRRRRDFRLTDEDFARLRPTGWRSVVAAFASPRLAFTQPLAAGLTTLGVAGLLLASLPSFGLMAGAAAPASTDAVEMQAEGDPRALQGQPEPMASPAGSAEPAEGFGSPAASAAASAAPGQDSGAGAPSAGWAAAPSASPSASDGATSRATPNLDGNEDSSVVSGAGQANPPADPLAPARTETQSILIVLGGSLLIAGLGLFALRWFGRRLV